MIKKAFLVFSLCSVLFLIGCQTINYNDPSIRNNEPNQKETIQDNETTNNELLKANDDQYSDKNKSWQQFKKPSDEELQKSLTPLQYEVTQEDGTEQPFNNEYWDNKGEGIYVDVVSGEPLFSSTDKFDSKTGWPSFTKPLVADTIVENTDYKLMFPRTEVRSRYANSHLGHVFKDGPPPTNLRYCMNSAALLFIPKEELEEQGYGEFAYLFE